MREKLAKIQEKYNFLNTRMLDPEVTSNPKEMIKITKEISELEPVVNKYNDLLKNEQDILDANLLKKNENDNEIITMLDETIVDAKNNIEKILEDLKILLLPKDENDDKNIMMEIRGAAGGDEANIFAGDLLRMYSRYAENQGWKIEMLEANQAESGGFSYVALRIIGQNVYSFLKFESGSHRVQRIPETESQGRIHTSTATVVIMPEIEDIQVEIKDADLKIDTYRASGAGGQHVNTTDSAVRITHIPTGIVATSQSERSQIKNREHCLKMIKIKVYDFYQKAQQAENDANRRGKLGTGDRSEKIRTYNYPQNRVTDHRIGLTLNKLDQVIDGKLSEIIDQLRIAEQAEKLQAIGE